MMLDLRWGRATCVFLITVLVIAATDRLVAATLRPTRLQAGAAKVDVSPRTLPALMNGGFLQASQDSLADPLYARAVVLADGNETLAIVVVDSCMLPRDVCDAIKQRATAATGIRSDRILITATHTHTAPSAMEMCLGCGRDEPYVSLVTAQVADAIEQAATRLRPAKLGWAVVEAAELTNCRRWITRSDRMGVDPFGQQTVRAMMHPGYQNPAYTHPAGPVDPWLTVLSVVESESSLPICLLGNLSMHYFGSGGGFSADYFGEVARLLEQRLSGEGGDGLVGIMSQGTSGDLHWMNYAQPQRSLSRHDYAVDVANRMEEAFRSIEHRSDHTLSAAETRLTFRRRLPSHERLSWAEPINRERGDQPARSQQEVYAQQAVWIDQHPEEELVLQAMRIGGLGLTAIPCEVYGITGLKLKRQSPLSATLNFELANGAAGYIPPPEQHLLGGYTTWPARTAGLEEQAEPKIVDAVLSLLEEVSGAARQPLVEPATPYAEDVLAADPVVYWRLGDMASGEAADSCGHQNAQHNGGVALFLPGPQGEGFATGEPYGNRSVYLAGGSLEADLEDLSTGEAATGEATVSFWLCNKLPVDARDLTGAVLGMDAVSLAVAGRAAGGKAGVLQLQVRGRTAYGTRPVSVGGWHQVTLTRSQTSVQVFLDGREEPEVELAVETPLISGRLQVGAADGATESFDGLVDEVAVFRRVLSGEQVASLYAASGMTPPHAAVDTKASGAEPTDELPDPLPTDAADAIDTIHVREGSVVELVAAEPLVIDPVAIDWGPDGSLWVAEMADYPLGLDDAGKAGGRVRRLRDTDGDGHYDSSVLFAEGLSFPNGVLAWGDGVLVTAAPEILYLKDTNGDGRADHREPLYTGFLEGNQQLRVNGLRWGLDNWVACASGSHHAGYGSDSQILSHRSGERTSLGSRDFRIQPDSGGLEPLSGPSQYGRNRDDWGNWFGVQNSLPLWHYVLEDRHIRRNPHYVPPDPKWQVVRPVNPPVFPASSPQKRYHSFEQSGRFTSACSAMIYRDDLLFSRGSEQHAFTCEPFHNLVQHNIIEADGVTFRSRRDPAEDGRDFFASSDRWCRPVMARTGPDGALWVVDMYRFMIEHPEWLPADGQDELRPWFRAGSDRGRIYRIVPRAAATRAVPVLSHADPAERVAALEHSNGVIRDMAQRLLVRSGDLSVTPLLVRLASSSSQPLARLHAICTLEGLDSLTADILQARLADPHPGVRRQAVRLAAELPVDLGKLIHLANDADAGVRQELAATLGGYTDAAAAECLGQLLCMPDEHGYVVATAMTSLTPENVARVVEAVLRESEGGGAREAVIASLLGQAIAMGDATVHDSIVQLAAGSPAWRRLLAAAVDELEKMPDGYRGLSAVAQQHLEARADEARHMVADASAEEDVRAEAVRLVGRDPERQTEDYSLLASVLVPQSPVDLQQAVVWHLATRSATGVADVLLTGWASHSPQLREQVLGVLATREAWRYALRDRVQEGVVRAAEVPAPVRQRLLEGGNDAEDWQRLFAEMSAGTNLQTKAGVSEQVRAALDLSGEPSQGEASFRRLCLSCHALGDEGHAVGPQLASITDKSPAALLTSVLDPNAAVDANYLNYVLLTTDGRQLDGRLVSETASSITLLASGGVRHAVLRSEIDVLQASMQSVMPEGLGRDLSPQNLADLIAFVRDAFASPTVER